MKRLLLAVLLCLTFNVQAQYRTPSTPLDSLYQFLSDHINPPNDTGKATVELSRNRTYYIRASVPSIYMETVRVMELWEDRHPQGWLDSPVQVVLLYH